MVYNGRDGRNIGWVMEGTGSLGGRYFERQRWCRRCPVILTEELGHRQHLELSQFGSSHLGNADSREGITVRNRMLKGLTSWLPGSGADRFLSPDLPNYFVRDQSRAEPRNHINAGKEGENGVCGCFE